TFCSCTNPALPACGPTTTTSSSTTTSSTTSSTTTSSTTSSTTGSTMTTTTSTSCTCSTSTTSTTSTTIFGTTTTTTSTTTTTDHFTTTPPPPPPTTSTIARTTTATTTSTTTTTPQVGGAFLEFTTGTPGGTCGNILNIANVLIENLTCGGLNLGNSFSLIPEDPTPDGSTSLFALTCAVGGGACDGSGSGSVCNIGPTSTAPPVNSAGPDCTDVGCNFGTPLPIPSPAIPTFSTCALNTWSAPASGTLDLTSGTSSTNVALSSDLYLDGNLTQPQCQKCVEGRYNRGPSAGLALPHTRRTGCATRRP